MSKIDPVVAEVAKKIFADCKAIITDDHFVYAEKPDGHYHGSAYVNKDAVYPHHSQISTLCSYLADHFKDDNIEVVIGPTVGGVALAQWTAHHLSALSGIEVLAICSDEEELFEDLSITAALDEDPVAYENKTRQLESMVQISDDGGTMINFGDVRNVKLAEDAAGNQTFSARLKVGTKRVLKRGYDSLVIGKYCLIVEDVINSGLTVAKTIKAVDKAGGIVLAVGALCNRSGGKVDADAVDAPDLVSLIDIDMPMYPEATCPLCKEFGVQSVRQDIGKGKEFLTRVGLTEFIK